MLALAAINYTVIHSPYVLLMTFILFVHELGHYLVAKKYKAFPSTPVFLPIPFFGIAFTKIKNNKIESKDLIALYGMIFSSMYIISLLFFNLINPILSFYFLFSVLFTEIFFNYFGLDGYRYRQAKYKTKQNLS